VKLPYLFRQYVLGGRHNGYINKIKYPPNTSYDSMLIMSITLKLLLKLLLRVELVDILGGFQSPTK
jgi:hypothetical protein